MSKQIIKFQANWCGPCKTLKQTIENEVKPKLPSDVKIREIDVDENDELVQKYKIRSIPVLIFEVDGVEVSRITGSAQANKIMEHVNVM